MEEDEKKKKEKGEKVKIIQNINCGIICMIFCMYCNFKTSRKALLHDLQYN